jgi:hypothetical protein
LYQQSFRTLSPSQNFTPLYSSSWCMDHVIPDLISTAAHRVLTVNVHAGSQNLSWKRREYCMTGFLNIAVAVVFVAVMVTV